MTSSPPKLDAKGILDNWLSACASNPWASLTTEAAQPYVYIWLSWARFIEPKPWTQATGTDVLGFLASLTQASHARQQVSDVTRRRYWRVIDRVYEHAMLLGQCSSNPAQAVSTSDRPPQENPVGAVLSMAMWSAIEKNIPVATDLISARDRCIFMALMELGLTSQEICRLTLHDVADHGLRITGPRPVQHRTMPISPQLSAELGDFMQRRAIVAMARPSDALFMSREEPAITTQVVQRVVSKHMRAIAYRSKLPVPVQLGAQIIRNTVLLHWLLDDKPMREVLAMSGLKSPRALTHLREYLPRHIRAIVATSGLDGD